MNNDLRAPSKNLKWFSRGDAGSKTSVENYRLDQAKLDFKASDYVPTFIVGMMTSLGVFYVFSLLF